MACPAGGVRDGVTFRLTDLLSFPVDIRASASVSSPVAPHYA